MTFLSIVKVISSIGVWRRLGKVGRHPFSHCLPSVTPLHVCARDVENEVLTDYAFHRVFVTAVVLIIILVNEEIIINLLILDGYVGLRPLRKFGARHGSLPITSPSPLLASQFLRALGKETPPNVCLSLHRRRPRIPHLQSLL